MGTLFKYIADNALPACLATVCHQCERKNIPIFNYAGRILNPEIANNVTLAREEPDVDELCADCILGGNVEKRSTALEPILQLINRHARNKKQALTDYHRLPDLRFTQYRTWPLCCGEFTEYVGREPEADHQYDTYQQWEPMNDLMKSFKLNDFYPLNTLPVTYSMALFRCLHCPKRYWIFQYSGLLWRGPQRKSQ